MSLRLVEKTLSGDIDSDVANWLRAGLSRWQSEESDLETCLGIDRASRLRQRNIALREAARMLDDGQGAWSVAGRLAAAIARYQARIEPLLRRNPDYPVGELDRAIQRAFAAARPPTTQRRVYDAIN